MTKDNRHENILQQAPQKFDQRKPGGEEEKCFEEDREKKHDDEDEEEAVAPRKDKDKDDDEVAASRKDDEEEECKTPSSSDHKIPVISSCPTAPRKKARMSLNCHKRKLSELHFFETSRSEEVETLFRSNSESFSTNNTAAAAAEPLSFKKRRCRSA